jgi:hypothetical protein
MRVGLFDVFTGEPVVIHSVTQTGFDIQDADELAELLGHPAMTEERPFASSGC